MKTCFSCNKGLDITERPGRGDTCPFCGSDLKVCLNCRFYDKKDRANFCDYFEFRESGGQEKSKDTLKKLKGLFGDS
jgi:predicted RNA-binding Zn-ribbon protein involved in translation (DUF1610 family)